MGTPPPSSVAQVLAEGDPQVWRTLLVQHTADELGRCRVCRRASGPADRWPCRLWLVADSARRNTAP